MCVCQNGEVFIFTGMLDAVADIHQLVFILGHEMAHALIGHAVSPAHTVKPLHRNTQMDIIFVILSESILIQ